MKGLLGGILVAVGLLIAGASGLCSIVGVVTILGGGAGGPLGPVLGMLMLIGLIGGIPFSIGCGLFFWGRKLLQAPRDEDEL